MYVAPELQHIPQARRIKPGLYDAAGRVGPSVTKIIGATESEDFRRVISRWRESVGATHADRVRDQGAERGSRLHNAIESIIDGDQPGADIPPALDEFLGSCDKILGAEVPLVHQDHWYTGTADLVVIRGGQWVVVDWKTCTRPPDWTHVAKWDRQLAAYARAIASWGCPLPSGLVYAVPDGRDPVIYELGYQRMHQAWLAFEENLTEYRARKLW